MNIYRQHSSWHRKLWSYVCLTAVAIGVGSTSFAGEQSVVVSGNGVQVSQSQSSLSQQQSIQVSGGVSHQRGALPPTTVTLVDQEDELGNRVRPAHAANDVAITNTVAGGKSTTYVLPDGGRRSSLRCWQAGFQIFDQVIDKTNPEIIKQGMPLVGAPSLPPSQSSASVIGSGVTSLITVINYPNGLCILTE